MKAIILARVSSKEQQEGYSIQTQTEQLTQYCYKKNYQILRTFQIVESSTRGDRKEFNAMLEYARKQEKMVALITSNIDRLQRSFREYSVLDGLIQEEKIEIHFVNENKIINKDSSSSDKLMWNIGIAVAQNYTDVLSEKVKGALQTKRDNGEWTTRSPLGYKNLKDELTGKKTIILDKERAFLVKKIFIEYATGIYSLNELTKIVKNWGLRNNSKGEKPISVSQLHRLIKNPFYYGELLLTTTTENVRN
jgi:site-specific DNA recombinase